MPIRVAVIGVRGVGKFHAQWFAKEGCEVVAFVSSSPETIAQNETAIKSVVPNFRGQGYCDLREMLEKERPDAVSVCSPHHLHAEHCLEALRHGVHVLCEKPLVWSVLKKSESGQIGRARLLPSQNGSDWRLANSEWRDGSEMTKVASWRAPDGG
jgi:UDP-N-acetylglucosamine 3-dehydrogenase